MTRSTTRIIAGDWGVCSAVETFCHQHFGPGGVQKNRRWFYRLLTPVTIEAYWDFESGRMRHRRRSATGAEQLWDDQTAVYFRNPADAVWFSLKFGVEQ